MRNSYGKTYSYSFIIPGCTLYFIFFILPSLLGIFYSFTYWDIYTAKFSGLANFVNIFTDPDISIFIKNTLIFAIISTFFKVSLGLVLAVFLNRNLKTRGYLRTVYFLPAILNNVAVGLMFISILHPTTGILNQFLRVAGLGYFAQDWLTNTHLAIFSVAGIEVWKWTGFTMVILLSGLQSVPKEYYEASDIDGANGIQKFMQITLPLIMPAFNNAFILNLIGGLKVFDIIYATTQGGPGSATEVINTVVFKAFGSGRYGEASAGSLILGIIVGIIAMGCYSILRKKEVEI